MTRRALLLAALLSPACGSPDVQPEAMLDTASDETGSTEDAATLRRCRSDDDCQPGHVCEAKQPFCNGRIKVCVPGCHDDADCRDGQLCNTDIACLTCPCPGQCEDAPRTDCREDGDCPRGQVCEPAAPRCDPTHNACVPGCHDDADCGVGEQCNTSIVCITCPCPGQCEPGPRPPCSSDADCGTGTVCELGPGCDPATSACVPGCHADSDCASGEVCDANIVCITCPCPGSCIPAPPKACSSDAECADGTVCEPGIGCDPAMSTCVPGCHSDADCNGGACLLPLCITCPCPGVCHGSTGSTCGADSECPQGTVCEGCSTRDRTCVSGCRADSDCPTGTACEPVACITCPCPAQCQ